NASPEVLLLKCLLDGEAYAATEWPRSVTCLTASTLNSSVYRLLLMDTPAAAVDYGCKVSTKHGAIQRGDLKHPADRLDSVGVTVFGDKPRHGLKRRSSSAWAKYADALRRIPLACRSSRFSRSSAFIR